MWKHEAACRGLDPDLFHGSIHDLRRAQRVCAGCSTAEACLWTAMVLEDPVHRCGVWGGLLPRHRRQLAAMGAPSRAAELLELARWAA